MENDFIEIGKKKYSDEELINGMGPLFVYKYWQSTELLDGYTLKKGTVLYNAKHEPLGTVVEFNKKKTMLMVKLIKPIGLEYLYMAGVELKYMVFQKD